MAAETLVRGAENGSFEGNLKLLGYVCKHIKKSTTEKKYVADGFVPVTLIK